MRLLIDFTGLSSPVFLPAYIARLLLSLVCLLALGCPIKVYAQTQVLPVRELQIGSETIIAQIAATPKSRQRGLMFRESLPPNHGMLFVFNRPDYYCFWMKNTPLPLSIAFIDETYKIQSILSMAPYTEAHHCSQHAVPYALEMPQGWFENRGIVAGDTVQGVPPLAKQ